MNGGALTEIRAKAEAQALFEKRAGYTEREQHFAKLRLLAEAGLGVLSFNGSVEIDGVDNQQKFRILASAFERGKLLEECELLVSESPDRTGRTGRPSSPLSLSTVARHLRDRGYTHASVKSLGGTRRSSGALVPRGSDEWRRQRERDGRRGLSLDGTGRGVESVPWIDARSFARERGIALQAIPRDTSYAKRRQAELRELARRKSRALRSGRKLMRELATARLAKELDPAWDEMYSLIRKTLDKARTLPVDALDDGESRLLDRVFAGLYEAEDMLGKLIRSTYGD